MIPSLIEFLEMLRMFMITCVPSGKSGYLLIETCFNILKIDNNQNPLLANALSKYISEMKSLYTSATLLLKTFFKVQDYRESCVQGLVSLCHTVATSKPIYRPFPIEGSEKDRISTAAYAIMVLMQHMDSFQILSDYADMFGTCYKAIDELVTEFIQVPVSSSNLYFTKFVSL